MRSVKLESAESPVLSPGSSSFNFQVLGSWLWLIISEAKVLYVFRDTMKLLLNLKTGPVGIEPQFLFKSNHVYGKV